MRSKSRDGPVDGPRKQLAWHSHHEIQTGRRARVEMHRFHARFVGDQETRREKAVREVGETVTAGSPAAWVRRESLRERIFVPENRRPRERKPVLERAHCRRDNLGDPHDAANRGGANGVQKRTSRTRDRVPAETARRWPA